MNNIPNALFWHFSRCHLKDRHYLKDIDYIAENLDVDYLIISFLEGMVLSNVQQSHKILKEICEYAGSKGIKVGIRLESYKGFFNANVFGGDYPPPCDQVQLFPIPDPEKAEAIACEYEVVLDENGYGEISHKAKWGRVKIMPIDAVLLKIYVFDKTAEGFYRDGSLEDVTDQYMITESRTNAMTAEIRLGKEYAGKTAYFQIAQYYNSTAVSDAAELHRKQLDAFADIGFKAVMMDEYGYMVLNSANVNTGAEEPFRGRIYSKGMKEYYREDLHTDLDRLLFDMRYAPEGKEAVRIRAINTYFETLRVFPLRIEHEVSRYAKTLFGDDCYICCHNTFHNALDVDEIWHTACNWWDLPRKWGHTDENIGFPVRWGVMLAAGNPIMIDMFYSKEHQAYYDHIIAGAPLHCRDFHHAYGDFFWGSSYTEPEFLEKIRLLDRQTKRLNDFQCVYPKMDLLVIFGASAQTNWYPDYAARNLWDVDGSLKIQEKCDRLWNAGYRLALVPDYAIEDGRITLQDGKLVFGGYAFSHCLFMYPKYAKKETLAFLDEALRQGVQIAALGECGKDFEGSDAELHIPVYAQFDPSLPEKMGCGKSGLKDGCIYDDGSFCRVSHGLLTGERESFDFSVGGVRYTGNHTGLLAYRRGAFAMGTEGSTLFADGVEIPLNFG